jgi:3-carboxy-cis,cis-muconate cycloisomerase
MPASSSKPDGQGEGERQRAGGRGPDGEGERQRAGGGLFDAVLVRGGVRDATSDAAWLQALLDVEAALARATAAAGLIDAGDAAAIEAACRAGDFDAAAIGADAAATGNPVVPLVQALTAAVGGAAAAHVHRGATSQDIMDTAAMLVAARALVPLTADLRASADAAAGLARRYRDTPAAGRTLLQHAVPVTFGLKAAQWLAGLDDAIARLDAVLRDRLAVQLGGAAGTLAVLGDHGLEVVGHLARELDLAEPAVPWHTIRTRPAELAGALGTAAGVCAKIARDVILLAQTEVGEVTEDAGGRGGSSTMPHKHNPVAAIAAVAAAARAPGLVATLLSAMPHEHERAAGAWHAEWLPFTDLLRTTGSAAAWLRDCLTHLRVDIDRVRANLDLTAGLSQAERVVTALAGTLGRPAAHELVAKASDQALHDGRPLLEVLSEVSDVTSHLERDELRSLLDPARATGSAARLVDRALAHHTALLGHGKSASEGDHGR